MLLADKNKHPRDLKITFKEEGHVYTLKSDNVIVQHPISVTTIIHKYFPQFNADLIIDKMMDKDNWFESPYFGMTKEEIKDKWQKNGNEASSLGTLMHADIERYLNDQDVLDDSTKEFGFFLNFWKDFSSMYPDFKPYRTEWLVYDESGPLCGSIDCILSDQHDNIMILDWKRSKEIKTSNREKGYPPFEKMDNCNLSHYQLQLNIYRHILETKYDKNVIVMMLVIFHPNQSTYKCIKVEKINIPKISTLVNSQPHNHG